jgi:glycine oxidase
MRQPEHIVIAGGGIIGLACALLLKDRGFQVTVFEAGEAVKEASWAAGGMLAAEDPENPPALLPFSRYSRSLYPSFLARIETLSGHHVPLRTHQTVQIVDPAHPASAGSLLSHEEASKLIPALNPALAGSNHGYLLLEEASLDPRELCTALRSAVTAAGVVLHQHEPVLSAAPEGEAVLLTTRRRALYADAFVNCCGAWASSLDPSAAVVPAKGQMLVVAQPEAPRLTRVLRSPEVYLIPRDHQRIVIGATVEDAGYSRQVEPAALSLLRRRAAALWPPAADAPELASWAGLRPATADGLPLIGLIGQTERIRDHAPRASSSRPERSEVEGSAVPAGAPQFLATGHHRNGILLAPGTAQVIADLIAGRTPAIDLAPFARHRASLLTACDKHFAAAL